MKLENVTNEAAKRPDAAPRRWYEDACGTAHALQILGERWAILILREMMFGPRRFGELRAGLPGISANILTQRLDGLEAAGVVIREKLPSPANAQVYGLTPWGYEAEPIIQVMGRWATRSPDHDPTLPLSAASLMLSFRTMIDAGRAGDFAARIGFRIGQDRFVATLADGQIPVVRGEPDQADVTFTGDATVIAGCVYGGVPLAQMEAAGLLSITGDRALAERFVTFFPLPEKITLPPRG